MNISDFQKGHIYKRDDLIDAFKGSFMRGMNKCKRTNSLVLISKHTSNRIYGDKLFDNNMIIYTGEGQVGNQTFTGANKDLRDSDLIGLPVYLFVVFKNQQYTYYGRVHLSGEPFFENELDVQGHERKVIRFPLALQSFFQIMGKRTQQEHVVGGHIIPTRRSLLVVGAAIVDVEGKVLCAQRGSGSLKGKWEFPGGKIEKGETDAEAIIREIKEELDIEIEVIGFIDENYYEYNDFDILLKVYKCKYKSGKIKDVEHQALRWVEPQALEELDWAEADRPIVETYLDSLPRTIEEQIRFDYFETKAIKQTDKELKRAIQDFEKSQKAKQKSGDMAEEAALNYEKDKLNNAGRPDLAEMVKQVSKDSSDLGYDILSFEIVNGIAQERHIEVKSTKKTKEYIEFFISDNELTKFKTDPAYKIYCLIKVGRNYKLHEVNKTDFFKHDYLLPMSYRVRIRIAE